MNGCRFLSHCEKQGTFAKICTVKNDGREESKKRRVIPTNTTVERTAPARLKLKLPIPGRALWNSVPQPPLNLVFIGAGQPDSNPEHWINVSIAFLWLEDFLTILPHFAANDPFCCFYSFDNGLNSRTGIARIMVRSGSSLNCARNRRSKIAHNVFVLDLEKGWVVSFVADVGFEILKPIRSRGLADERILGLHALKSLEGTLHPGLPVRSVPLWVYLPCETQPKTFEEALRQMSLHPNNYS